MTGARRRKTPLALNLSDGLGPLVQLLENHEFDPPP